MWTFVFYGTYFGAVIASALFGFQQGGIWLALHYSLNCAFILGLFLFVYLVAIMHYATSPEGYDVSRGKDTVCILLSFAVGALIAWNAVIWVGIFFMILVYSLLRQIITPAYVPVH